jgi:hypothetical protein
MNIYREVVNRIEIPALPSLENGYYLLRFERNGTTSNVYAVVENESGMGVPITASLTEIGTGTPDPEAGEVLLAPGAWTLFFYEQVSGTNTNPDCSTIPLGQTEVTVYGEDAAVLSQTPTACPSGPGGGITSVNSDTGPAVQLDAVDIPFTPMFVVISGSSPDGQVFRDTGVVLENRHRWTPDGTIPPDPVPTECYYDDTADLWTMVIDNVVVYSANSTAADPSLVSPSAWVVDGGVLPLPVFVSIEATDVQAAVEEVAAEVAARPKYLEMRVELSSLGDANPIIDGGYNELSSGYAVTGHGTGDYRITFDDPVLPQYLTEPEAFSVDPSTPFHITAIWSSTVRVDVKAWDNASSPSDPSKIYVVIRVKQ